MKIAQEATEQSRGVQIPIISWCENVKEVCEEKNVIVFDIPIEQKKKKPPLQQLEMVLSQSSSQGLLGIV
jgi:16S rRNA U1498 N3-methylase RsmE